jgi:hypothetical protein
MLAQKTHVIPHASMAWLRRGKVESKKLETKGKKEKTRIKNKKAQDKIVTKRDKTTVRQNTVFDLDLFHLRQAIKIPWLS